MLGMCQALKCLKFRSEDAFPIVPTRARSVETIQIHNRDTWTFVLGISSGYLKKTAKHLINDVWRFENNQVFQFPHCIISLTTGFLLYRIASQAIFAISVVYTYSVLTKISLSSTNDSHERILATNNMKGNFSIENLLLSSPFTQM